MGEHYLDVDVIKFSAMDINIVLIKCTFNLCIMLYDVSQCFMMSYDVLWLNFQLSAVERVLPFIYCHIVYLFSVMYIVEYL